MVILVPLYSLSIITIFGFTQTNGFTRIMSLSSNYIPNNIAYTKNLPDSKDNRISMASVWYDTQSTQESKTLKAPKPCPVSIAPNALPQLTPSEYAQLSRGEIVQKQSRTGRSGTGSVVLDVDAPADLIFDKLSQFHKYDEMIPTVRNVNIFSQSELRNQAEFSLSKFRLKVGVVHSVHPAERIIKFSLDPSRSNLVLRKAEGLWYFESLPDRPDTTRIWFTASIVCSRLLPTPIVDYAACRALPRATRWIRPYFGLSE